MLLFKKAKNILRYLTLLPRLSRGFPFLFRSGRVFPQIQQKSFIFRAISPWLGFVRMFDEKTLQENF